MPFRFREIDITNSRWTAISGNWNRSSSMFSHTATGVSKNPYNHFVCEQQLQDGAIEAAVRVFQSGDNSGRLAFRFGPSGCYYAGIGGYRRHFAIVKQIRSDRGEISSRGLAMGGAETDIQFGQPYDLRVEFIGDMITLKSSGVTVLTATDYWFQEGNIGLETFGPTNVEFNNLRVYEIPPLSGLVRILESFPYTLKRDYTYHKRELEDEKDVQRILWTILRSHYPDLVDEEVLGRFGLKHYKDDFGLPSLATIIEVKMIYENTDLKKLQEELMTDSIGYFASITSYRHLIFFIYNKPNRQVDSSLITALESLSPVAAVLLIPGIKI